MEFWSLVCDQLSEVVACDLCALDPPANPVVTACGHCFCWPCMYDFLQGQAKPCPVCSTMLSSDADPTFDTHGALVLGLPTAEEVEASWDDDMLDWSDSAAFAPCAAPRSEEEPGARRDGCCKLCLMRKPKSRAMESVCVNSRNDQA